MIKSYTKGRGKAQLQLDRIKGYKKSNLIRAFLIMFIPAVLLITNSCDNEQEKNNTNGFSKDYEPTLYDVPKENSVIEYRGDNLILARVGGKVYALSTQCGDRGCSVSFSQSEGVFNCKCNNIDCNYLMDGSPTQENQTKGLDRYKITAFGVAGVKVEVDIRSKYKDTNPAYANAYISVP